MKKIVLTLSLLLGGLLALGILMDIFDENSGRIDACLDAGGKWDYKNNKCLRSSTAEMDMKP
jgi:hypothetical protein